jgi:hypothetical protein
MPATVDYLASVALELTYRVREDDPEANGRWLAARLPDPADWFRLAFVAAAAIPQDRSWHDLTAWARNLADTPGPPPAPRPAVERRNLQPCGTRAAYRRHRRRGETACQPCRDAAAAFKRKYTTRSAA